MKSIYLITRLYNTGDKIRTCELENYLKSKGSNLNIYMPYRDVDEDKIKKNWKKTIFERDIDAINKANILIGYWDGTEYDEGIGFEIGYALSKNKKIIVLNSDFLQYNLNYSSYRSKFPDPILDILGIDFLQKIFKMGKRDSFYNDLKSSKQALLDAINLDKEDKRNGFEFKQSAESVYDLFIECGSSLIYHNYFMKKNERNCYISRRFIEQDSVKFAELDLTSLLISKKVYVVANGSEMNLGSSIICGLCYGHGIPFYLINDRLNAMISMTGVKMPANLMIDCATEGYTEIHL